VEAALDKGEGGAPSEVRRRIPRSRSSEEKTSDLRLKNRGKKHRTSSPTDRVEGMLA